MRARRRRRPASHSAFFSALLGQFREHFPHTERERLLSARYGTLAAMTLSMQIRTLLASSSLLLVSAVSLAAGAQERQEPRLPEVAPHSPSGVFGARHELAISSDAGLSISTTSVSGVSGSTTTLVLRPAIDYFVIDNLSLGGFIGVDSTSNDGGSSTTFGIGPRVGYNVPFSERWSVWPKVGFSFSSSSVKIKGTTLGGIRTSDATTSNTALALNLFVPVMFHPVEHFFLGFGPALDTDLSGDAKVTTFAGRLTLGGWI